MTGETHEIGARLRELVLAGDLAALRGFVDQLTGADLKAARSWVTAQQDVDGYPWPDDLGDPRDQDHYSHVQRMRLARLATWGRLAAPVAAAKAVAAESTFLTNDHVAELVPSFVDRDGAWAQAFATAADGVRPSARGAGVVFLLLRAVVEAHGLPAPAGALFHGGWIRTLAHDSQHSAPAEVLRKDPLLPDVVHLQLASGESGGMPDLAKAIAPLAREGMLDRHRLVADVLAQLTAGQKPNAQRVLASVLTELEVSAPEVPGGLDFLLSVLSSCHDSAVAAVLDLALDLVASGDQAVELARVVAPRSGRGVRRTLLAALAPDALGTRIDHAALLDAIDVLAAGDDDVADLKRYDRARIALGGTRATEVEAPAALGLWDLDPPDDGRGRTPAWSAPIRDRLWRALRTGETSVDAQLTDDLLAALAHHELPGEEVLATAHELAAEGALSPARAASVLEPLFLGGAMRVTWPAALEIADLCAAPARPAVGLDKLLRMLTTYAVEVPRPADLPSHVVRLVGGKSKTAQEAERLAIVMGSSTESVDAPPTRLGLWREGTEPVPWALAYPPFRGLDSIGHRIASTPLQPHDVPGAVRRSVLTSLLLDELVALVAEHGADVVRARVTSVPTSPWSSPFAKAVTLWAQGLLSTDSYWAMARSTTTVDDLLPTWLEEMEQMDAHRRYFGWTVEDGIATTPPVMPRWWSDHHGGSRSRLEFLHACEVLLVVERGGHLVSSPDVIDGTLGLERLRERLAAAPRVGPIDLRLALGRLRPFEASGVAVTTEGAVVDAAVTSPAGDREDLALEVLGRWVAGGGLHLTRRPTQQLGVWDYDGECDVPWRSCAALEAMALDDGPPRQRFDDVFVVPGRPDLWLRHGFHTYNPDDCLADVGGELGVLGWCALLTALGTAASSDHRGLDFTALTRLQDQGRLDPAQATAAATARWDEGLPDSVGALGWERATLRGALRGLWPVAVAVARAGLERDDRPADLDALLSVLRRRVHEVPPELVPDFLADA